MYTFDDSFIFKFNSPISQVGLTKLINHFYFLEFAFSCSYTYADRVCACVYADYVDVGERVCVRACVRMFHFFFSQHLSYHHFGEQQPASINCFSFYMLNGRRYSKIVNHGLALDRRRTFLCHFIMCISESLSIRQTLHTNSRSLKTTIATTIRTKRVNRIQFHKHTDTTQAEKNVFVVVVVAVVENDLSFFMYCEQQKCSTHTRARTEE